VADTYGMVVPYVKLNPIVFKQTLCWFGGPNEWGIAADGTLQPYFFFPEYMDTLKFWRKMYAEKLINEDFAVYDPNKWNDPVIADKAGVIVDVVNTRSNQINTLFSEKFPEKSVDVFGAVAGPKGVRSVATSGFGSVFLFSKQAIKDLPMLKRVLAFEDKLGDRKMQDLTNYGVEGRQYTLVEGHVLTRPTTDLTYPKNEFNDFNQITPFIPTGTLTPLVQKPWVAKYEQQMIDNLKIVVGNPAAPFSSPTEGMRGSQLNAIIEDIYVKYTAGQMDDQGVKDALALWRKTGGDDVIKEYNEQYKLYGKNAPKQ
jgi:putative aldouronate transport system substrate-binding protein